MLYGFSASRKSYFSKIEDGAREFLAEGARVDRRVFFFCGEKLEVDSKSKTSLIALNRFHRRRFDPPIILFTQRAIQGRGKPQEIQRTSQGNKQRHERRNFRRNRKITATCSQIQGGDAYSAATERTKEGQGKKIGAIFRKTKGQSSNRSFRTHFLSEQSMKFLIQIIFLNSSHKYCKKNAEQNAPFTFRNQEFYLR